MDRMGHNPGTHHPNPQRRGYSQRAVLHAPKMAESVPESGRQKHAAHLPAHQPQDRRIRPDLRCMAKKPQSRSGAVTAPTAKAYKAMRGAAAAHPLCDGPPACSRWAAKPRNQKHHFVRWHTRPHDEEGLLRSRRSTPPCPGPAHQGLKPTTQAGVAQRQGKEKEKPPPTRTYAPSVVETAALVGCWRAASRPEHQISSGQESTCHLIPKHDAL
mmetsp:Transcript_59790/g.138287  ORF Transcript_59790/g.138287 Transcript_59790/m.138287 type:complete len:214 (-) Transcript_59790:425-1066(-)